MPKPSGFSFLSWPGTMALRRWTAVLLLVFGLAVVWQFGGGGPGAGLEGACVGKAKALTSRFPQRVRLPASRGTEPAWGLVALGRWVIPPKKWTVAPCVDVSLAFAAFFFCFSFLHPLPALLFRPH